MAKYHGIEMYGKFILDKKTTLVGDIPTKDGILVYDENTDLAYVSKNGSWIPLGFGGFIPVYATSNITAEPNNVILADSRSNPFTVTMPANLDFGARIKIIDVGNSSGTNNITVNRNGYKMDNLEENLVIDVNGVTLIFTFDSGLSNYKVDVGGKYVGVELEEIKTKYGEKYSEGETPVTPY